MPRGPNWSAGLLGVWKLVPVALGIVERVWTIGDLIDAVLPPVPKVS
jgi:hypothetical protein